jgi:hypothetical protein
MTASRPAAGLAAVLLPAALAAAAAAADPAGLATAAATAACLERGATLQLGPDAVQRADLTGDGSADDWLVSERGAACVPEGGPVAAGDVFRLHAVVGAAVVGSWEVRGFVVAEIARVPGEGPQRMLILWRPGGACGLAPEDDDLPCAEALVWAEGAFRSVAAGGG